MPLFREKADELAGKPTACWPIFKFQGQHYPPAEYRALFGAILALLNLDGAAETFWPAILNLPGEPDQNGGKKPAIVVSVSESQAANPMLGGLLSSEK
jgi:hypothetical protein